MPQRSWMTNKLRWSRTGWKTNSGPRLAEREAASDCNSDVRERVFVQIVELSLHCLTRAGDSVHLP